MTARQARRLLSFIAVIAVIAVVAALVEVFRPQSPLPVIVHYADTTSAVTSRPAPHSQAPGRPSAPRSTTGPVGADRLYRSAREAMARRDNLRAIVFFERVARDYPQTAYVTSALYYRAFLQYQQYRPGNPAALRAALVTLRHLQRDYPKAPQLADAQTLETRICGDLAQLGDAACKTQIATAAQPLIIQWGGGAIQMGSTPASVRFRRWQGMLITSGDSDKKSATPASPCQNDQQIEKLTAALDGLWKVDSTQALQATGQLLGNRQPCFNRLREQALLIITQRPTPVMAMAPVVFDAARNDPSPRVRQLAKMWLMSQAWNPGVTNFLSSVFSNDANTKPALPSLSSHQFRLKIGP